MAVLYWAGDGVARVQSCVSSRARQARNAGNRHSVTFRMWVAAFPPRIREEMEAVFVWALLALRVKARCLHWAWPISLHRLRTAS